MPDAGTTGLSCHTDDRQPGSPENISGTSDTFDLVITDIIMPGMTGEELSRELLKIRPDIPIIICSGISREDKAGIQAYLSKPLSKEVLAGVVRKVLDEKPLILVIGDDEQVRLMLREILERGGYHIIEASDGKEGIEMVVRSRRAVHLIITDILMPGKEGLETIRELREKFPEIKIVAFSGGGRIGNQEAFLDAAEAFGVVCTFSKPFRQEELLKTVGEVLK